MNWQKDFKNGKKAGKKYPQKHDADIARIEEEEDQNMNRKKDALLSKKAELEVEIKQIKANLALIERFITAMR